MSKKLLDLLLKAKERGCPFTEEESAEIDSAVAMDAPALDPPPIDEDPTHPKP